MLGEGGEAGKAPFWASPLPTASLFLPSYDLRGPRFLPVCACNNKSPRCLWLIVAGKLETDYLLGRSPFLAEPTLPSRICSSTSFLYFLLTVPCILLILLLISLFCYCHKARKLSAMSLKAQKEKSLWMNLKGTGDWTINQRDEEDEDH